MNFEQIILEDEQKELFIRIVETMKQISRENRGSMIESSTNDGTGLIMPTKKPGQSDIKGFARGDLDILAEEGLLRLEFTSKGNKRFTLRPISYIYYEWLMKQQGKPVERIEKSVLKYIELDAFKTTYIEAYKKLKLAEEKLWESDSQEHFTTIGHNCREAMQEFADKLYEGVFGNESVDPKPSTVKRLREIIEIKGAEKGETVKPFLEALLAYWGTLSDLVQRQEHGGQKEGEPLTWEDARRVVFQTVNVMVELDRTVGNKS